MLKSRKQPMHVQHKKSILSVSACSFTHLPSVQFSPHTTGDVELHFPLTPWKIGFLIRGKCLFSFNIVITFFSPKSQSSFGKILPECFCLPKLRGRLVLEISEGKGEVFSTFLFWNKRLDFLKTLRYGVWQSLQIRLKKNSNYTCMLMLGEHLPPQGRGLSLGSASSFFSSLSWAVISS